MNIPASRQAPCEFCTRILDADAPGTYQWTSGWVMRRDDGGGHGISLPVRANRFACRSCIDRAIRGTLAQSSLFGD